MSKTENLITLEMVKSTKHGWKFVLELRLYESIYGLEKFNEAFGTEFRSWAEFYKAYPLEADQFIKELQ